MAQAKKGKPKMTQAEKDRRAEFLKNETKSARFIRLVEPRVNKILSGIEQVGKLSGSGYESTDKQVDTIFGAITEAAKQAYGRFQAKGIKAAKAGFKLQ